MSPTTSYQLYTLHGFVGGEGMALGYCGRYYQTENSSALYRNVFRLQTGAYYCVW